MVDLSAIHGFVLVPAGLQLQTQWQDRGVHCSVAGSHYDILEQTEETH